MILTISLCKIKGKNVKITDKAEVLLKVVLSTHHSHVSLLFQIIELSDYKDQVEEFRRNPVFGKSPKVTRHVGEVIGSLLISHAGT